MTRRKPPDMPLPPDVAAVIAAADRAATADPAVAGRAVAAGGTIDKIRDAAGAIFVRREELAALEGRMATLKEEIAELVTKKLPDLFDEAGVKSMEIDDMGNLPALSIKLQPFYSASISAKWPEDRRQAAFTWLEKNGHAALIRTVVSIPFDKSDRKKANALVRSLRKQKLPVEVASGVHAKTLTSWLQVQVEKVKRVPPLDVIGGFIGREVKIKPK